MRAVQKVAAAFLGISVMIPTCSPAAVSAELVKTDAETLREYTEIMVSMVNDARVAEGLNEVSVAPVMNGYAQIRAEELPENFSHDRPEGKSSMVNADGTPNNSCFTVMKEDGFFYNFAAENIAAGNISPVATFEQYMNSEKHRKNILTKDMTHIGIGYVYDPTASPEPDHLVYQYYWSMLLIGSYDPFSVPVVYEGEYIPERELGDADGSKSIDAGDASRIMQFSAKRSAGADPLVTNAFSGAADVNGDGRINAVDASIVLAYSTARGADPDVQFTDYIW